MKKGSTLFLKTVIYVIGIAPICLCTYLIATTGSFNEDPYWLLVALLTTTTIPFLVALYQGLTLLRFIDKNNAFSESSVNALRKIRYCGLTISGLYTIALPYLFQIAQIDDAPGIVLFSLIINGASLVIAVFATVLQKLLRNAIDMKTENDLTV